MFEWNCYQKSIKPEVRAGTTNIKKRCRNGAKIHENAGSELNKKRCLKTELNKLKQSQKMNPKRLQRIKRYWGNAYWGAFGPNRFCDEEVGPQRSQSTPKNET